MTLFLGVIQDSLKYKNISDFMLAWKVKICTQSKCENLVLNMTGNRVKQFSDFSSKNIENFA